MTLLGASPETGKRDGMGWDGVISGEEKRREETARGGVQRWSGANEIVRGDA